MSTQTIRLTVNGISHQVEIGPRTTLLEVLREHLGLIGTKNGCGQGHCGACTVIMNGQAVRSCVTLARRADGAAVETIEGLARPPQPPLSGEVQLHPLQRAFVEAGAIQCGFCTPGMIMAAKALLDKNPTPTEADIEQALKRNLCRCTGYAKIVEAIQVAAGLRAAPETPAGSGRSAVVGQRMPRPDAVAKATGAALFAADYRFPGMLHARVLRSAYPHARIRGIDASQARSAPGVVAVLTAADVPGNKNHGVSRNDWPVLAYDVVRYRGDAIAVVVAETEAQAEAALPLIAVDYEPLPAVFSPEEARRPDAPHLHPGGNLLKHTHVERGDVDAAFAQADVVIEQVYHTPATDHAFLEPEAAVAVPAGDGGVTVYVGSQIPFKDRAQVAASLALPEEKVRIVQPAVGGAFGGKEDISVQIHAALAAVVTGRPVQLVYTRQDSLRYHPKRHATTIRYKTGARRDGKLLAVEVEILGDTGAYASLGEFVMARTATHAAGPYDVPNVRIDSYAMYTNNPPAGALRGFGVPQACFACETQMDILAERLGLDPLELRWRNAVRVGSTIATGQVLRESVGLLETIERVQEAIQAVGPTQPDPLLSRHPCSPTRRRGWGVACAFKNVGLGGPLPDSAGAEVELTADGRCIVRAGAAENGQGLLAVLAQIAAQELGVPYERVAVILADTGQTLDGGATTASRQTFITGNAVRLAAIRLRESLAGAAAEELSVPPDALVFEQSSVLSPQSAASGRSLTLMEAVALAQREGRPTREQVVYTAPPTVPVETPGDTHFAYGYGTQAAEVEVDTETGQVRVLRVIAAHDVGRAINPLGVEGQLEGGVLMGLGFALQEELELDEGLVVNDSFARYKVPTIEQRPQITPIIVEAPAAAGPYGAKGVGEITSIPTAPAITNAIHAAVGVRVTRLPVTPARLREALRCRTGP